MNKYLKVGLLSILILIFGIGSLLISMAYLPELSALPAIVSNVGVALIIWYMLDRYVLTSVDTNEILKKGNNFAALLIALAIIIGCSIIAS